MNYTDCMTPDTFGATLNYLMKSTPGAFFFFVTFIRMGKFQILYLRLKREDHARYTKRFFNLTRKRIIVMRY